MWVPLEDLDPVLLHAPTRKSIAIFGAVCAADGRLVASCAEKFCAETFLNFLRHVLRHKRKERKMIVVVDNARYHQAREIQPWLKKHRNVLALDFLPLQSGVELHRASLEADTSSPHAQSLFCQN